MPINRRVVLPERNWFLVPFRCDPNSAHALGITSSRSRINNLFCRRAAHRLGDVQRVSGLADASSETAQMKKVCV